MTSGLIVGRFLPPHNGHVLLGETAQALVDTLYVVLCAEADDPIPPARRIAWLEELMPNAKILPLDVARYARRASALATAILGLLPARPDMFFSGDGEDNALAAALGVRHVQLDPGQGVVPVSGTDIRADPWANWRHIPAPVRPAFAKTICLHGPESTGKSTLAPALARHFDTLFVPEYGRTYCEAFGLALTMADLLAIGRTHAAMTRAALRQCNRRLILDTDPLMTAAWADMLFDRSDPWLQDFSATADFYLLLDIDMPWVDDGTRFFGDPARRRRFFECARDQLERRGLPYAIIGGPAEERFERALDALGDAGLG